MVQEAANDNVSVLAAASTRRPGSLISGARRSRISSAEFQRCQARVLAELLRERALVAKVELRRNLGDAQVRLEQRVAGGANPRHHQKLLHAQAKHLAELAVELPR